MYYKITRAPYEGSIPDPGELFVTSPGGAMYLRVFDRERPPAEGHIHGASLATGQLHSLAIKTTKRNGFMLYEPVDGHIRVGRKRK